MRRLASYQTGLWLAEYFNIHCQLCRVHRSVPQSQLIEPSSSVITDLRQQDSLYSKASLGSTKWQRRAKDFFNSGLLCTHCHHSMVWLPEPFYSDIAAGTVLPIQAASYYDYPMRQAIRAFKHHEDTTKLPLLLHALRQLPRPHGCHSLNSVIVPMPTTDQRLVKRGFDPVSVLSTHLSKHWQIPLWQGVLRIDDTVSQQGLTRAERLSNLDHAFTLIEKPPVKRLLLFDDVATTGASLQALGRILHSSSFTVSSQADDNYHLLAYALAHGSQ